MFFRGNTMRGGMNCPLADIQVTTVTKAPLSAEASLCTFFLPLRVKTFVALYCTQVIPVSSTLNILFAEKFILLIQLLIYQKIF